MLTGITFCYRRRKSCLKKLFLALAERIDNLGRVVVKYGETLLDLTTSRIIESCINFFGLNSKRYNFNELLECVCEIYKKTAKEDIDYKLCDMWIKGF